MAATALSAALVLALAAGVCGFGCAPAFSLRCPQPVLRGGAAAASARRHCLPQTACWPAGASWPGNGAHRGCILLRAEGAGAQVDVAPTVGGDGDVLYLDGRVLEVRAATPDEMTVLYRRGERLPNLLAPLSKLCASVLYGADYLHSAVATDFQSRYGVR